MTRQNLEVHSHLERIKNGIDYLVFSIYYRLVHLDVEGTSEGTSEELLRQLSYAIREHNGMRVLATAILSTNESQSTTFFDQ